MGILADISGNMAAVLFGICAALYGLLTVFLLFSWRRSGPGNWLIFASLATAFWAAAIFASHAFPGYDPVLAGNLGETIRAVAWTAFIFSIFERGKQQYIEDLPVVRRTRLEENTAARSLAIGIIVINVGLMAFDGYIFAAFGGSFAENFEIYARYYYILRLIIAVGLLMLLENIYRWSGDDFRWGVRMLVLALAGQNIFDVIVYADALLFGTVEPVLVLARPGIAVIIAPLLLMAAARNPTWRLNVFISRRSVFHTLTLIGVGSYLTITALAGYYVREVGGTYGTLFQVMAAFAALLFLVAIITSGSIRAAMKVFLSKHFFAYNYDYREEWLRFVRTVSDYDVLDLKARVIKAMCDIVESPGGSLWLTDETKSVMRPDTRWNFAEGVSGVEPMDGDFVAFLNEKRWIIDLDDLRAGDPLYLGLAVPKWVALSPRAWLVVPIFRQDELDGIFVLEKPRVSRNIDWEDRDILKTLALQSSSYLAEQESEKVMADTKQFRDFSERFAFVVHDIKNLTSQLNLLVQNAEQHMDNPEFRADMLQTLRGSVDKMHSLLGRLNSQSDLGLTNAEDIEVNDLVLLVAEKYVQKGQPVTFQPGDHTLWITGHAQQLENIIGHLVQNAIEAIDQTGKVDIIVKRGKDYANIIVKDDGCGMEQSFIDHKLFEPFQTTKDAGYGLGMSESRKIVNAHRGGLDVISEPGQGTTITIRLPFSRRSMEQSEPGLSQ